MTGYDIDVEELPDKLHRGPIYKAEDYTLEGLYEEYKVVYDRDWPPAPCVPKGFELVTAFVEHHDGRKIPLVGEVFKRPMLALVFRKDD